MAASWKTLRVFISSTFRDMQAERDHLVRFVFPRLREELLRRRIHLIDVDLRWGVTSDQDALSVCREVIDECHPRFIGVLGGRYGWVPPGRDQSITADEVHYGVLARDTEMRGNAFFYFRNERTTASIIEETPGDFREPDGSENARKLADLKQAIVNAGLPTFVYAARWDVEQNRLTDLEPFGDHVFAHLLNNIRNDPELDDRFTDSTQTPVDEFTEEREAMEAFIEDRTERYVVGSRQGLLDETTAFVATDGEPNILVIEGEAGSGKSALLGKLCQSLAAQRSCILIPHFVGASVGSTDLRRTLHRLCQELSAVAGQSDPLPEGVGELIDLFRKLLNNAGARQRVILILDAINQFDASDNAFYMDWLPQNLPPNVRVIASSLEHPALNALRSRGERVRIEKLEPLSEDDTRTIIDAFLQRYSKRFSAEQVAALLAKPESHLPLYVLTALQELRTLGTYEEITARIQELPGEVKALFTWILKQRLSNDPGFRNREAQLSGAALVAKFASCLGVSRHGLSQEELIGLIDPGDPLGNVAALLRLLRPYLMRRGELLDFFHNQLREAVEDEYLNNASQRTQAHQFLAVYFHDVADPNREGRWKGTSTHALSELPYHQIRAEAWPELVAILENLFFLEAKVTQGMAFDLALDFSDAITHLPSGHPQYRILKLLVEALRRDIHFIARHADDYPQGLFQSLWNTCWWHDCPDAAKHYRDPDGRWNHPGEKLHLLLEKWRAERERAQPDFPWLRSLRPPSLQLGAGLKFVLRGHWSDVSTVCYSPDGRWLASGSYNGTIGIWDVESGAVRHFLNMGGGDGVIGVCYSPDGRRLASGCRGSRFEGTTFHTVKVWDAERGVEHAMLREQIGRKHTVYWGRKVKSVCYSPDGRRLAFGSDDNAIRIWDAESGEERAVLSDESGAISVCFSPDGRWLASGSGSGTIRIRDAESGVDRTLLRGNPILAGNMCNCVYSVCYSPDGRWLASGSLDGTIRICDAESGTDRAVLRGHRVEVASLLTSSSLFPNAVNSVCYSPDGRWLASGSNDGTVRIWDVESGTERAVLCGHESSVHSVCFSPDGRWLASGSADSTIRVWDAASRPERSALRGHEAPVSSLCCSPDGRRLTSGSKDKTIRVWDAVSGVELAVLQGHERTVTSVCYSPDGRRIATGSDDKTIRIWDAESGVERAALRGHEWGVSSVCYSPDGLRLASGSYETIRIWDAESGAELGFLRWQKLRVMSVCYSPEGQQLTGALSDNTIRVWDVRSLERLAILRVNEGPVNSICYSPDGRELASVCWEPKGQPLALPRESYAFGHTTTRLWDMVTYVCTERVRGRRDIATIAGRTKVALFRLLNYDKETVLGIAATGKAIGLLSETYDDVPAHPWGNLSGRLWAGSRGGYFALFRLEGAKSQFPEEKRS